MFGARKKVQLETERMTLRPPAHADFRAWAALRHGQP
jgi:ribosomal-protein-alanine N-acetyltransferase